MKPVQGVVLLQELFEANHGVSWWLIRAVCLFCSSHMQHAAKQTTL